MSAPLGTKEAETNASGTPLPGSAENITVERGAVSVVILERQEKKNALTLAMWRRLENVFSSLSADPEVRAVVLAGRQTFCAGADISEFPKVRATVEQGLIYEHAVEGALAAIGECPRPVIAAISGFCVGGGMGLAQACDFRLADRTAMFGIPAARLGIVYGRTECRQLLSLVGLAHAKRILFGGTRFDALEAARIGFADLVDGDVVAEAIALAETFAGNAPLSISGMKLILDALADGSVDDHAADIDAAIRRALDSEDYREAVAAFASRREPRFKGS